MALCTTRAGGFSVGPWAGLNLADHVGDAREHVDANRKLLSGLLPQGSEICWLSQVHGRRVIEAPPEQRCPEADALWSRTPGAVCAVMTADCLPVLFCTTAGDRVAAAHAGWRGLLGGVLEATAGALQQARGEVLAWMGPAIGPEFFEVGPEVRDAFLESAATDERDLTAQCFFDGGARPGHFHADLYALARLRLRRAGIESVFGGGLCTFSEPDRFYSYRRDGRTGRMASLILIRPE
jgi:YfiH family protein